MRIAVLGINGLVGDAFLRNLDGAQLFLSRHDVDFLNTDELSRTLRANQIEVVVNCSAVVGGIELNRTKPYDMFSSNIALSESVLRSCIQSDISDLVQFCSNCSYPDLATQPFKEHALFDGPPHRLNRGFASAKRASVFSGQCAEDQGLIRVYHPIPCSLFGRKDNYSLNNSHFIAAAVRKIFEAKQLGQASVSFWGTGTPLREFMYADNLVSAVLLLLDKRLSYQPINIGTGVDTPIKDIIELVTKISGFNGDVVWDSSKPDGAMRKVLDSSVIRAYGWMITSSLEESLRETYHYYTDNLSVLRR